MLEQQACGLQRSDARLELRLSLMVAYVFTPDDQLP
jgi:hypothetical protein